MKNLITIGVILLTLQLWAQELPPVASFYPQDYKAGDQNWAITQSNKGFIYVANNKGLLEYDGSRWLLYPSPNQSILRSVKEVNDRIYTGQYRDFGYWERNDIGVMSYTSLVDLLQINPLEDEEFWGIVAIENWLMFQSLDRIYIINKKNNKVSIIDSETTLTKMISVDGTIYFQKLNQGIFKIENGQEVLVTNDLLLRNETLVDLRLEDDYLLVVTQNSGIYELAENSVKKWVGSQLIGINSESLYSALSLKNGNYLLGSISNGLYMLGADGQLVYNVNKSNGLSNNTILSIFEDNDGNIWLGMDNGIALINQDSAFRVYYDEEGELGTVYSSEIFQNVLFLGTNQGLFSQNSDGGFSLVEGTEGQVWALEVIDNKLFCGHDRGTFLISGTDEVKRISSAPGAWAFKKNDKDPNIIIQGNYNGLYVLEKVGGNWGLRNKIEGFNTSTRYFEFLSPNEVFVSHEYKGVFKLVINEALTAVVNISNDSVPQFVNSSLVKFKDDFLYSNNQGIYKYDFDKDSFVQDSVLSKLSSYSPYVSGKLIVTDDNQKLWYASQNGLSYVKPDNFTGDYKVNHVALPIEKRATKSGYENILGIGDSKYVMGTTEGYMILDLNRIKTEEFYIVLNEVSNSVVNGLSTPVSITDNHLFSNKQNNFSFKFSTAKFEVLTPPLYQYRLSGIYDQWSPWTANSEVFFENLPHGNYTFEAKSRIGDVTSVNSITFNFTVDKPWYFRNLAIFSYVIMFLLIAVFTHSIYRQYYKNQRNKLLQSKERELEIQELEAKQQIMKFRNENLQLDIENKNRELGLSTMNLIKKNELLGEIKNQLVNIESLKDIKGVVKRINQKLNTSADWKLFEEAFNNADKDFLKNIKAKHPALTSNDLRLCAYLRLNLSSKEIAPLLNISHKSVEVKRYRLRKKMNLDHEINLTDYILQV